MCFQHVQKVTFFCPLPTHNKTIKPTFLVMLLWKITIFITSLVPLIYSLFSIAATSTLAHCIVGFVTKILVTFVDVVEKLYCLLMHVQQGVCAKWSLTLTNKCTQHSGTSLPANKRAPCDKYMGCLPTEISRQSWHWIYACIFLLILCCIIHSSWVTRNRFSWRTSANLARWTSPAPQRRKPSVSVICRQRSSVVLSTSLVLTCTASVWWHGSYGIKKSPLKMREKRR